MRKRLAFCVSITLAVVLGFGPLLTLAAPAEKRINDSSRVAARAFAPNGEASKPAKPPFNSKLLSRRPLQNEGAVPGQTATLLPDGRVLKIGGLEDDGPMSAALIEGSSIHVQFARAWHTATMLPDGTILIVGGMGADGQPVDTAEIFNPDTRTSDLLTTLDPRSSITPRVYHTATLLTEGLVLISGGVSGKGDALITAQLWDFRTRVATTLRSKLKTARYNHAATLLANGKVLLSGGSDKNGANLENAELYDPQTQHFTKANPGGDNNPQSSIPTPRLTGSLPEDGATNVLPDALIAFRFSNSLRVETVNTESVTLNGPYGRVEIKVVPAEGGMLAFVTPKSPLFPGAAYTVSVSGPTDTANDALSDSAITFSTAPARAPIRGFDDEEWIPDSRSGQRDWQSGRSASAWQSLPPLQARPGVTALAGQVLKLNGKPLANVTLKIDDKTTETDDTGRFLLAYVSQGHHELLMDGRTASRGAKTYGVFEAGIEVKEAETNILPYTIWMPKLDTAHIVTIPSPTTTEVVVTTPHIPGLEVHIPPHTVIYDEEHKPVTRVSITPIPVDRPPFPLPLGVQVPIYFTVQPGGAYVKTYGDGGVKGARIIYPNYTYQPPGARANFWHYDPEERGWYVYGQGTVTDDGGQTVPDPGVAIYEFTGAMVSFGGNAPTDGPPPGGGSSDGDPVDLYTGLFVLNNTDMVLPDLLPIVLSRTYRPRDTVSRAFGIGATHPYNMFLVGDSLFFTYAELILPDGGRIRFNRISPGNGYNDAIMEHTATPTAFYKSRVTWNGPGGTSRLRMGVFLYSGTTVRRFNRFATATETKSGSREAAVSREASPGSHHQMGAGWSSAMTRATASRRRET